MPPTRSFVAIAEVSFDSQGRMTSGELRQQKQCSSLENDRASVCLAHLNPPGEDRIDRITVDFAVDHNRVLLATVKDLLTGQILVEKSAIAKLK